MSINIRLKTGTPVLRPAAPDWDGPYYRPLSCGLAVSGPVAQPLNNAMPAQFRQFMWMYHLQGQSTLHLDAETHAINPGQVLCYPLPNRSRFVAATGGHPAHFLWICFTGSVSLQFCQFIFDRYGTIHHLPRGLPMERAAMRLIRAASDQTDRRASIWSDLAFDVLSYWLQACEEHAASSSGSTMTLKVSATLREQPSSVKEFARTLGYSRSYLSRLLKEQWRQPPAKLLRKSRLETAATTLRSSNLAIEEIAQHAGYSCHNSFSVAFAREFGKSPSEYRRRSWSVQR